MMGLSSQIKFPVSEEPLGAIRNEMNVPCHSSLRSVSNESNMRTDFVEIYSKTKLDRSTSYLFGREPYKLRPLTADCINYIFTSRHKTGREPESKAKPSLWHLAESGDEPVLLVQQISPRHHGCG